MENHSIPFSQDYEDWVKRRNTSYALTDAEWEHLPLHALTENRAQAETEPQRPLLFLDALTQTPLQRPLSRYGIFQALAQRGFQTLDIAQDSASNQHRLALYLPNDQLVFEMVLKRYQWTFASDYFYRDLRRRSFHFLVLDWLYLQDPRRVLDLEHLGLPGQAYPGLGMGELVLSLLNLTAHRLQVDGLLAVSPWYHTAWLFNRLFNYINPQYQGKYQALYRDSEPYFNLAQTSWALASGCVQENRLPFEWFYGDMLMPYHPRLKAYFQSHTYQKRVQKYQGKYKYLINSRCIKEKKPELFL